MRAAMAGLYHESNTYSPIPTSAASFLVSRGAGIRTRYGGTNTFVGGMLHGFQQAGVEPTLLVDASAAPSAPIDRDAYEALSADILAALARTLPLDAVCLNLHGAATAQHVEDVEGDLVARVRELVGPGTLVGATLDLHATPTRALVAAADVLIPCLEYPHVDERHRGQQLVALLMATHAGRCAPVMSLERVPLLPTDGMATDDATTVGAELMNACRAAMAHSRVLHAGFLHGFPWADLPRAGAAALVVADGDPELAQQAAARLAARAWELRERMLPSMASVDDAVAWALAHDGAPVVLADFADNPGGGGPGDGTHLLRRLLADDVPDAVLGALFDPRAAAAAHAAGEGASIEVELGAHSGELFGPPISTRMEVRRLTDGRFTCRGGMCDGLAVDGGPSARLGSDGRDVVVVSERFQTFDPEPFRLHGIDVSRRRIVAVKSATHFRHAFAPVAHAILPVDSPGVVTPRLERLPRRDDGRGLWPLDRGARYAGAAPRDAAASRSRA